jgi:PleD family two-component response regulator
VFSIVGRRGASRYNEGRATMSQEQEEYWRVGPVSGKRAQVVEDDTPVGELLLLALAPETSYHPLLVSTEQEILRAVQEVKPVLVLLDYQLP